MTPLDQTLVDQIKTALSKSAPDVARGLSATVKVKHVADSIYLFTDDAWPGIFLSPQAFQNLEQFAVKIGWRCS